MHGILGDNKGHDQMGHLRAFDTRPVGLYLLAQSVLIFPAVLCNYFSKSIQRIAMNSEAN